MAFIGKTTPTRGALIRLKGTLEFIREGKEVLKMKRDRLAGELNDLIKSLERRKTIEGELLEVYRELKEVLANLGYATVASNAWTVPKIETEITPMSIMGVTLSRIAVTKKPSTESIQDLGLHQVTVQLQSLIVGLFTLAQTEANIERISYELMMINRKVSALEKIVIPEYERKISYIQDLLFDEDLENFVQTKHIKNVVGRRKS